MTLPRLRPPWIALSYLGAAWGLDALGRADRLVRDPWRWLGLPAVAAGLVLVAWALRLFARGSTTHNPYGEPSALVTDGPFRFTRNPMYVGVTSVLSGIALLVGTLPFLAVPVAFAVTIQWAFVPREEANLARAFGPAWDDYRRRVRRWL